MKPKFRSAAIVAGVVVVMPTPVFAAPLSEAQITSIIKDVRTVDREKAPRPSKLRETLHSSQAVRTGLESRTELLFNDKTLTRIGANSHFTFTEGTRNLELYRGVILLQVPKGAGGARIHTAAVTAAVTGTTILMEAGPGYSKFIVLEGTAHLTASNDKFRRKTAVKAGQAVIMPNTAKQVPPPVFINIGVLVKTSRLINGTWAVELNTAPITTAIAQQTTEKFTDTNLAIIGPGTDVVFLPEIPVIEKMLDSPPRKTGSPTTIKGAYAIKNSTTIKTDPVITTDGVDDFGKIYQGNPDEDGASTPTEFVFGSDTPPQPEFDKEFKTLDKPAVFRFQSLTLEGGPDIDSNDGPRDLVLASVGGITSGGAGPQNVNLSSLDSLTLAALGSITLDPDLTFNGSGSRLWLSGNDITVNSAINL